MRKGLIGSLIGVALSLAAPAMAEKPSFESYIEGLKRKAVRRAIRQSCWMWPFPTLLTVSAQ